MSPTFLAQHPDLIGSLIAGLLVPALFSGALLGLFWLDARRSASGTAEK
jgi:hypothetical protein